MSQRARPKKSVGFGSRVNSASRSEFQKIVTFLAIGVVNTVVGTSVFLGLYLLGVQEILCNLSSVVAGVSTSLVLHRRYSNKSWSVGVFTLRFCFSATVSYLLNLASFYLVLSSSFFHPAMANIIATVLYSICFYSMMNFTWQSGTSLRKATGPPRSSAIHKPTIENLECSQTPARQPSKESQVAPERKKERYRRRGEP